MEIRRERPADYEMIYQVIKEAFASADRSDGNEQDLVVALRKGESYISELSLVATIDKQIVGHIMFTKALVNNTPVLALAPLSVLPAFQHKGVGTALIKEGHRFAKALGYGYSVVLGSETYYPRFGYKPADSFGIFAPFDVPRENFMAFQLDASAKKLNGTMEYAKKFGIA